MSRPSRWFFLLALPLVAALGACTEDLQTGGTCPVLCPGQGIVIRDTVLEGTVVLDSNLVGFPFQGSEDPMVLAAWTDTLDIRVVARFDSLTGGRTPDWGAGVAFPDSGVIVLPGYASERVLTRDLPRVLRHELAHVALQRHLGAARVPRWFTEGYATWAAGQLDTDAAWLLRVAFLMRRTPPLDSLVLEWPRGQADARIAYLLSASAIEYLVENGGERALTLFLERWRESGDFDAALRDTYGLTFGQLERYWGRAVRRRYGWMLFLAQSAVLWMMRSITSAKGGSKL